MRLRQYIAAQGLPLTADRFAARLIEATEELELFPERGRLAGRGERELVVIPPYVIRYRAKGREVGVISIRHSARR